MSQQRVWGPLSHLLPDTQSINNVYSSNHTLEMLYLPSQPQRGAYISSLLQLNENTNKSHVAINKILKCTNMDMEPLFDWNMEGEGEQDFKALPHVIA